MTRRGWLLFSAMSVIWGIPYLLIKVAVREISPVTLVFARCLIALLLLLPVTPLHLELGPVFRRCSGRAGRLSGGAMGRGRSDAPGPWRRG